MEDEPANVTPVPAEAVDSADAVVPTIPTPSPLSRTARRVKAAADALRTLLRDLHLDRHGAEPPPGSLELSLRLLVHPARQWELAFDPPLVDQIDDQMAEARAARDVFLRGAVHCFRCGSSSCEHARPPSLLGVFHGYDETGRPEWVEFHQALLEAKDERIDQLYARPPVVLTGVQFGRQLRGRQLSSFGRGSRSFAILGQVIAGYFPVPGSSGSSTELPSKLAITFQIVEARDAAGAFRLHVHAVTGLPGDDSLEGLLASDWQPDIYRARGLAARALSALEHRVRGAREGGRREDARDMMREVPAILHRLAAALDRGHRQARRRTQHAEQRRQESRPVHKAVDDARTVKADALFFDLKSEAFIVCGPKGRTHAFNERGRHVTSFLIKPDSIDFRLRTGRWRRSVAEEFSAFRERMGPSPGGEDEREEDGRGD